jgi:hypothetical protein
MLPVFAMMVVDQTGGSASIEHGRDFVARAVEYTRRTKQPLEVAKAPVAVKTRAPDTSQWRLEVWVGPFSNEEQAQLFCELWRATSSSRDTEERRSRVLELAKAYRRTVWTFCPALYQET